MFFKFLHFDIHNGIAREWKRGFVIVLIFYFINFYAYILRINATYELGNLPNYTVGDYLLHVLAGMNPYIFNIEAPFVLSPVWTLFILLPAFLTLRYPLRDMSGTGKYLLVLSGNRSTWWGSKCFWLIIYIAGYFLIFCISSISVALISGGEMSLVINEYAPSIFQIQTDIQPPWSIADLLPLAFLTITAECFLQLLLSLLIRPNYAFLTVASLVVLSCYFNNHIFFLNYSMAARSGIFISDGFTPQQGYLILLGIIICCSTLGLLIMQKKDILNWSEDE